MVCCTRNKKKIIMQNRSIKNKNFWLVTIIIFFLIIRFMLFFHNFTAPPVDEHGFRQMQNLMTIRNYYREGINLFLPKVDMFGSSVYSVQELPIYQAMTALLYKIFVPQEFLGRFLSIIFTILSSIFLYLITKRFFESKIAVFSVLFFLFSPLVLFYSRTIMLEPMEVFLFLASLHFYLVWSDTERTPQLWTATILSTFFILVKPMYGIILFPIVLICGINKEKPLSIKNRLLVLSFAIQGIFLLMWFYHTQTINHLFPNSFSLTRQLFFHWFLGPLPQHFNLNVYFILFARILDEICGKVGIIFILLSFWEWKNLPKAVKTWSISSFAYLAIFTNINLIHNYYQLLIAPLVAILMAVGFKKILDVIYSRRKLFIFLVIFALAYANADYSKRFFELDTRTMSMTNLIKQTIPANSKVVYIDFSRSQSMGNPTYHYLTDTKGYYFNWKFKEMDAQEIFALNKREHMDYFVLIESPPEAITSIFLRLNSSLLLTEKDILTIYHMR